MYYWKVGIWCICFPSQSPGINQDVNTLSVFPVFNNTQRQDCFGFPLFLFLTIHHSSFEKYAWKFNFMPCQRFKNSDNAFSSSHWDVKKVAVCILFSNKRYKAHKNPHGTTLKKWMWFFSNLVEISGPLIHCSSYLWYDLWRYVA